MFSKAARFVPDKDNGVPGPGAYNPNTEYLEPNKLGAVVDKADRFKKVKPSDIPGPGTYNTTRSTQDPALTSLKQQLRTLQAQLTRLEKDRARDAEQYESKIAQAELRAQELVKEKSVLQSEAAIADKERRAATQREATLRAAMEKSEAALKNLNDKGSKLGSLQRKLEDLEKVHAEGKKRHRDELERLNLELDQSRRQTTSHSDKVASLLKESDVVESRNRELTKQCASVERENQSLRAQLLDAEKFKAQLTAKQAELEQLKKTVDSLDARKKDGAREQSRKLAEAERVLEAQKKQRDTLEEKLRDATAKLATQEKDSQAHIRALEETVQGLQRSADEAIAARDEQGQGLEVQLTDVRAMMGRVVEEYARLAASSAPSAECRKLKFERARLQLKVAKLELKLGNREEQITMLTGMTRQAQERSALLESLLSEAESDLALMTRERNAGSAQEPLAQGADLSQLRSILDDAESDARLMLAAELEVRRDTGIEDVLSTQVNILLDSQTELGKLLKLENKRTEIITSYGSDLEHEIDALRSELVTVRTARTDLQVQMVSRDIELEEAKAKAKAVEAQVASVETRLASEKTQLEEVVREERERTKRLNSTISKAKMSEQALQAEVETLSNALTDAARFEEAHSALLKEVGVLVSRNALAEHEAEHLSRFNAEILSHTNANQKIFYVDRIRRELAETKQNLVAVTWERDQAISNGKTLQLELETYKSVAVPLESKPRTAFTRVGRPVPLGSRNLNSVGAGGMAGAGGGGGGGRGGFSKSVGPEHLRSPGGRNLKSSRGAPIPSLPSLPTELNEGDMTLDELSCVYD